MKREAIGFLVVSISRQGEAMRKLDEKNMAKARELHLKGLTIPQIAKKANVSTATIRRWKKEYNWPQVERNKGGAPKGSHNAKGHGAKKGNTNALKHGAYSNRGLDQEEEELISQLSTDPEELILEEINLLTIRERRIMKALNKYYSGEDMVIDKELREEKLREFETPEDEEQYQTKIREKITSGDRLPGHQYTFTTEQKNKDDYILRLEKELSSIQSKKTKAIDILIRIRLEREKQNENSNGNSLVKAWVESVTEERKKRG